MIYGSKGLSYFDHMHVSAKLNDFIPSGLGYMAYTLVH